MAKSNLGLHPDKLTGTSEEIKSASIHLEGVPYAKQWTILHQRTMASSAQMMALCHCKGSV